MQDIKNEENLELCTVHTVEEIRIFFKLSMVVVGHFFDTFV